MGRGYGAFGARIYDYLMEISRPIHAGLWMLGAVASFSAMAVAGRELSTEMNTFELMMYRSAIGFFLICAILPLSKHGFAQVKTNHFGLHLSRNIVHFTGQNLWFYGIAIIPFSQLVALEFTNPIWVALLAPFFLGETMTKARIISAVIGFVGVLIVAQPSVAPFTSGHAAGLAAALAFAVNTLFTKKIMTVNSVLSVLFWMTLLQFTFGLALSIPGGIPIPSYIGVTWVFVVAICGLTAHYCLTMALSIAPASIVAPMDFIRLPIITLLGVLLYDEPLLWPVIFGTILIVVGNMVNIRAESRKRD